MEWRVYGYSPLFFAYLAKGRRKDGCRYDRVPEKVWEKLDKINSATYYEDVKAWEPGDTIPVVAERLFCKEYTNPKDTTIGSSFVILKGTDNTRFEFGYNGEVNVTTYHDKKGIMIDDFTHRDLPFRLVSPPFLIIPKVLSTISWRRPIVSRPI